MSIICLCAVPEIVCSGWPIDCQPSADDSDSLQRLSRIAANAVDAGIQRAEQLLQWDTPLRTEPSREQWRSYLIDVLWYRCGGSRGLVAIPLFAAGSPLQDIADQVHLAMWDSLLQSFQDTTP